MPGIYVFYSEEGTPLYVGKTVSFKRRFVQHAASSEFFDIATKVRLYPVKNEYEKDIYETYLISELRPEYNKAKTFYSRLEYEDALHAIEVRIFEVQEEIANMEKCLVDESSYECTDAVLTLGEALHLRTRVYALRKEVAKLHARKGALMSRLSA